MLTNMESQLKEQGAADRLDEVLAEIPSVRKELGFIPLVTPTSQIVGTQAVLNVLTGERYKSISKETSGVLRGEYGATPAQVDKELQERVLDIDEQPITCRPADRIESELETLSEELYQLSKMHQFSLTPEEEGIDDVLTYALFPQVGLNFLKNRGDASFFEPVPMGGATFTNANEEEIYTVEVENQSYVVRVAPGGDISAIASVGEGLGEKPLSVPRDPHEGEVIKAPLAGTVVNVLVSSGHVVKKGDPVLILEAMKMETQVSAPCNGNVAEIHVRSGDSISVGDSLVSLI